VSYIEKRKRKKPYRVRYRAPDGTSRSATFSRRIDADDFAASTRVDMLRGSWVDPRRSDVPFKMVADRYMRQVIHLKPKTQVTYEVLLRTKIMPAYAKVPLSRIQTEGVREWVASLNAKGLSASQVRQSYFFLRSILESVVVDGRLVRNPCTGIKLPKIERKEMRFLDSRQVEALASSLGEEYDATLVYLLAYGGLRWGEAVALRGNRCDLLKNQVHVVDNLTEANGRLHWVTPKNAHRRSVGIPPFLRDLLARRVAQLDTLEDLVFTASGGAPLRYSNFMRRVWKPAVRRAGLPQDVTPHALRHTCAALLIAEGAHPKAIQVHLGHSSITVTMDLYGHLLPDRWDRATDGLDAVFHEARARPRAPHSLPRRDANVISINRRAKK
jgi:integrase